MSAARDRGLDGPDSSRLPLTTTLDRRGAPALEECDRAEHERKERAGVVRIAFVDLLSSCSSWVVRAFLPGGMEVSFAGQQVPSSGAWCRRAAGSAAGPRQVGQEAGRSPGRSGVIAVGVPGAALAGSVLGYVGFGTEAALPEVQRILPVGTVMLVLAFGAGSRQLGPAGALNASPLCVIGLHDHPTLVEHTGPPNGVEVGLTPHGAYTMLGVALRELSNTITDLADLLGDRAWWLQEQLRQAPTWEARFTMLDRTLGHWLQYGRTPDTLVVHAWQRLRQTVGRLPIGELARTRLQPTALGTALQRAGGLATQDCRTGMALQTRSKHAQHPRRDPIIIGDRLPVRLQRPGPPQPRLPRTDRLSPKPAHRPPDARQPRDRGIFPTGGRPHRWRVVTSAIRMAG